MTRILVIKTSSMGDVVHNMPVIADLLQKYPHAVIDWVVEEAYADLVAMVRGIDRVLPVALRRWRRAPHRREMHEERRAFVARLRAERYDVVLDTQGLLKSALLAYRARLARGGRRVGFSFGLAREPLARVFYDRGYAVDPRLHAIERMRALAAAAFDYADDYARGRLGVPRFELVVPSRQFAWLPPPDDGSGAASVARDTGDAASPMPHVAPQVAPHAAPNAAPYVVLLHATARAEKAWPTERWQGLIAALSRARLTPVLPWGDDRERAAAEALAATATDGARAVVAPRLTLVDCAALLAGARAVVGVDTGLLHLAAALDVATVGLFGATPRWRYAPYWSPRSIALGSFGEMGAQPGHAAVVDGLRRLAVLPEA